MEFSCSRVFLFRESLLSLMRCFIMAMSSLAIWRSRSFSTRFALASFNAGSMAVMEESFL